MGDGSKLPGQVVHSRDQAGDWAFDSQLRGKVVIAAVSAGVTFPGGGGVGGGSSNVHLIGGTTNQDVRIAAVSSSIVVPIGGTISAHLVGGTTNQDVRIAAVSGAVPVSGPIDIHIIGGTTNQDVRIAAVSASIPVTGPIDVHVIGGTTNQDVRIAAISSIIIPVTFSQTSTRGVTVLTTSGASGTAQVIAAGGATTKTEVRGFSICNEGASLRRFELRFGTTGTPFWRGSLAGAGGAFNWNIMTMYQLSPVNKAIRVWMNGAGTATVTVYYRLK
jgi:hypothetical protein